MTIRILPKKRGVAVCIVTLLSAAFVTVANTSGYESPIVQPQHFNNGVQPAVFSAHGFYTSSETARQEEEEATYLERLYFALGFTGGTLILFGSAFMVRRIVGKWNGLAKALAVVGYLPLTLALMFYMPIVELAVAVAMFVFIGRLVGVFPPFWWRLFLRSRGIPVPEVSTQTEVPVQERDYEEGSKSRVMVNCAVTDKPVFTGARASKEEFESGDFEGAFGGFGVRCPHCNKIHEWHGEHAYLEGH